MQGRTILLHDDCRYHIPQATSLKWVSCGLINRPTIHQPQNPQIKRVKEASSHVVEYVVSLLILKYLFALTCPTKYLNHAKCKEGFFLSLLWAGSSYLDAYPMLSQPLIPITCSSRAWTACWALPTPAPTRNTAHARKPPSRNAFCAHSAVQMHKKHQARWTQWTQHESCFRPSSTRQWSDCTTQRLCPHQEWVSLQVQFFSHQAVDKTHASLAATYEGLWHRRGLVCSEPPAMPVPERLPNPSEGLVVGWATQCLGDGLGKRPISAVKVHTQNEPEEPLLTSDL